MHFIIDDKAPVFRIKQVEMQEGTVFVLPIGEDIVRCYGDGPDLFLFTGKFADLFRIEMRLVEELLLPLAECDGVGDQYQGFGRKQVHDGNADNGFTGAAGQNNDAAASLGTAPPVECIDRALLVIAYVKGLSLRRYIFHPDVAGIAVLVSCKVLNGKAYFYQRLLDVAAEVLPDFYLVLVEAGVYILLNFFRVADFIQEYGVAGYQKDVVIPRYQLEEAVATHLVLDGGIDDLGYFVA